MEQAYLVSSDNERYQVWVEDDGSLVSVPYSGTFPFWFNPNAPDGSVWSLQLDDTGTLVTVKVS